MRSTLALCAVLALLACSAFAAQDVQLSRSHLHTRAAAAPDDPPASPPGDLDGLKPTLECISQSPGVITAYFGWDNPTTDTLVVPVGNNNKFVPDPPARSQTTVFLPGRSRFFPIYAFSVNFPTNSRATWQLNGFQVTANSSSAQCVTSSEAFVMVVDSPTAPTADQSSAALSAAATAMQVDEDRIKVTTSSAGLGKFQMVFNVSSSEDTEDTTPVVAMTNLFKDNTAFSIFIDSVIAAGLAPSSTEPMASGREIEGTPIGQAPPTAPTTPAITPATPTTPSVVPASPTPTAPVVPVAPVAPAPITPTPSIAPSGTLTPNSAPARSSAIAALVSVGVCAILFVTLL